MTTYADQRAHDVAWMTAAERDGYQSTDWDLPVQTETGIRCAMCQGRHENVAAVAACHVISRNLRDQQAAEVWAENAWLRAAEAGDPASWEDEQRERQAAVWGRPPPGM